MKTGASILILLFLASLGQPCLEALHCLEPQPEASLVDNCHPEEEDHCAPGCGDEAPASHDGEPCSGACTCVCCSPIVVTLEPASIAADRSVSFQVNAWVSRLPALDVDHLIWQPPQS